MNDEKYLIGFTVEDEITFYPIFHLNFKALTVNQQGGDISSSSADTTTFVLDCSSFNNNNSDHALFFWGKIAAVVGDDDEENLTDVFNKYQEDITIEVYGFNSNKHFDSSKMEEFTFKNCSSLLVGKEIPNWKLTFTKLFELLFPVVVVDDVDEDTKNFSSSSNDIDDKNEISFLPSQQSAAIIKNTTIEITINKIETEIDLSPYLTSNGNIPTIMIENTIEDSSSLFSLIDPSLKEKKDNSMNDVLYFHTDWNEPMVNKTQINFFAEMELNNDYNFDDEPKKNILFLFDMIEKNDYFDDFTNSFEDISAHYIKAHKIISGVEILNEKIFKMFLFHALTKISRMYISGTDSSLTCFSTNTHNWIGNVGRDFFGNLKLDYLRLALNRQSIKFKYFYLYNNYFKTTKKNNELKFKPKMKQLLLTSQQETKLSSKEKNDIEMIENWFKNRSSDDFQINIVLKSQLTVQDKTQFEQLEKQNDDFEKIIQRYNSTVYSMSQSSKQKLTIFFEMCNSFFNNSNTPLLNNAEKKQFDQRKQKLNNFLHFFSKNNTFLEKLKRINFPPIEVEGGEKNINNKKETKSDKDSSARRLSPRISSSQTATTITTTTKKMCFGKSVENKKVPEKKVDEVYKIIGKNKLGGGASGGPMYGELTEDSFQKIVDTLKAKYRLTENSRFIDIGCGQGKPNLHLAQDPVNVFLSVGIEIEKIRWQVR
jgi:hypothetical protein